MTARAKQELVTLCLMILACIGLASIINILYFGGGPRLVGYGCDGSAGPLFANEESDFPPCERIERL